MTMTLKQVLEAMNTVTATSTDAENWQVVDWCSALSAHIAAMGEPVAEVQQCEPYLDGSPNPMKQLKWTLSNCEGDLPVCTKLYLAPPASGNYEGVSNLLTLVAKWRRLGNADVVGNIWGQCADELSALIPPASGDWDKVREMIVMMRTSQISRPDWADKLTAALPESQP